ncbi:MAG: aminotransferase class IV [Candidatus Micrarchaeota archaeon]
MVFEYFVKNGEVLPVSQAVISLFNIEYSYGFGVYENVRARNGIPYFLDDHIERLFKSAETISLNHQFKKSEIKKHIEMLLERLPEKTTVNLKIMLIGAKKKEEVTIYILPLAPKFPDKKIYRDGVKTMTKKYERWFPQAKTLNMLPSYIYYSQAHEKECYDVLFVDNNGNIVEGSRTNFFAIKNNEIMMPPHECTLPGVTKKYVLMLAKKNGFIISERNIALTDMKNYDGAFLTSTSGKIIPIRQIDEFKFSSVTPELKKLIKLFDEYLEITGGN